MKNKKIYGGVDISELPILREYDFGDLGHYARTSKNEKVKSLALESFELSKAFIERSNKIHRDPTKTEEAKIVMLHEEGEALKKSINDSFMKIAKELQYQMETARKSLFSEQATLSSAEEAMLPQYVQMLGTEKKGSYKDLVTNPTEAKIILHLMKHNPSLIPTELKEYDVNAINGLHSKEAQEQLEEATNNNMMEIIAISENQINKIAPEHIVKDIKKFVV